MFASMIAPISCSRRLRSVAGSALPTRERRPRRGDRRVHVRRVAGLHLRKRLAGRRVDDVESALGPHRLAVDDHGENPHVVSSCDVFRYGSVARVCRRATRLGEHCDEALAEVGKSGAPIDDRLPRAASACCLQRRQLRWRAIPARFAAPDAPVAYGDRPGFDKPVPSRVEGPSPSEIQLPDEEFLLLVCWLSCTSGGTNIHGTSGSSNGTSRETLGFEAAADRGQSVRGLCGDERRGTHRKVVGAEGLHQHDSRVRVQARRKVAADDARARRQELPEQKPFHPCGSDCLFEIEHLDEHHFFLTIELAPRDGGTEVTWLQTFDSVAHYERIADFVATANEQNLDRLAVEVARGRAAPDEAP